MSIAQFSLEPTLHFSLFYNIEINEKIQDLLHFEPINIVSHQNNYNNLKKEIKPAPTINYDNNSLMQYKILVQKMRVNKARQLSNTKNRGVPDIDCNSYLKINQPTFINPKNAQRKHSQPQQRLPKQSFCHFSCGNEYSPKLQTKVNIRLPILEKSQVQRKFDNSLNCWTINTSSSLFQVKE